MSSASRRPAVPSVDRFRLIVDSVRDYAIFLLEPDGTIASWNPGAERFKGWKAEEIVGKHFSVFYPQAERDRGHPEHELRVARAEGRYEEEGWRLRKDGGRFWASVTITALRDETGTLVGFAKVTRDLTERKAAEERLRRSEERLRLLIESVNDYAIFMLDKNGRVESWNPGAQRIKGYAAAEIVGRHFSVFYPDEDMDAGKPQRELEVAAASGRFEDEGWRLRKDGSRFWANVIISAVRSPSGELLGFSKVTRDLTERRKRDQALAAALEDLRRSNSELEEYAAFVSHDLQEPLRKMASFAELLALRYRDKVDDAGRQYIAYIVDGAKRMRSLITDVLDYARIGRAAPPMTDVDLGALVARVLGDLDVAIKEAGAELRIGPLPRVRGNPTLLGRAIQNLVSNGLKFRKEGRAPVLTLSGRLEGGRCVLAIEDNGIGFPQELTAEILRPFRRLHPKEKFPGSGLGLPTVKKIVELHGGSLEAESRPGLGATFKLVLPASR